MSTENNIDLRTVLGHLLELTQVKEIVIAQVHIQILVKHICRH